MFQLCSKPTHTKTRDDLPSPSEFNFEILNSIHLQIFNNTLNIVLTSLLNSFFAKNFFTEHLITEWYSSKQPVSATPQGSQPVLYGKLYVVTNTVRSYFGIKAIYFYDMLQKYEITSIVIITR